MLRLHFTFLLLFTFLILSSQESQSQPERVTDGLEYWEYSEEELFKFLKAKYWKEWANKEEFDLKSELSENVILIRLTDNSRKINALHKAGRTKRAALLTSEDKQANLDMVDAMLDFYRIGKFYFYYPKDADAIFKKGDLSKLMLDENTPIKDDPLFTKAYVLMYLRSSHQGSKKYQMNFWDKSDNTMIKLKDITYRTKTKDGKPCHYRTLEYFCERVSRGY